MRKKKRIWNLIMVVAVFAIIISGIMTVGSLKGWFDKDVQEESIIALTENKEGGANIERKGLVYALEEGTKLREGDIIETLSSSSIDVVYGKNRLSFNERSKAVVHISKEGIISFEIQKGDVFANVKEQARIRTENTQIEASDSVFYLSAPSGSTSVSVLKNEVTVDTTTVKEGKLASILGNEIEISKLKIESLNDFCIERMYEVNKVEMLCFTSKELKALENQRAKEKSEVLEEKLAETEEKNATYETTVNTKTQVSNTETKKEESSDKTEKKEEKEESKTPEKPAEESEELTCTITIRCDTILNNMDSLSEGKEQYVPRNGCILATSTVSFEEGETVFDILSRVCQRAGIQLEYSWTSMYDSYYVEGINHLYEFDCGSQSGWMYKVNGWYPNYGCSSYEVKDGDSIVWSYTCDGLGADLGA